MRHHDSLFQPIYFPLDSGDPAWQRAAPGAVTIGYHHSAIGVADADRSAAFYVVLLGLERASRQVRPGRTRALVGKGALA